MFKEIQHNATLKTLYLQKQKIQNFVLCQIPFKSIFGQHLCLNHFLLHIFHSSLMRY